MPIKLAAEISLILQNIDIKQDILVFCSVVQKIVILWQKRCSMSTYPKNNVQEIINQRAFF